MQRKSARGIGKKLALTVFKQAPIVICQFPARTQKINLVIIHFYDDKRRNCTKHEEFDISESYNILTGEILISTRLQSLDLSGFIGNEICGPPLNKNFSANRMVLRIVEQDGGGYRLLDFEN
ncbi:hypothetical protein C1H46_040253 [Malus baccata]|uniref:Uncharacterized protein n=1 Tax=Malus baccata TaxID=106549 RepID=A0A540KIZ1_MALBA|nr:hypothetical protein C1H46_040253 [Malus baccata]